jgi:hypothetical protein
VIKELTFPSKFLNGISAVNGIILIFKKEDKAIAKRMLIKRKSFAPELFKAWVIMPIPFKESV